MTTKLTRAEKNAIIINEAKGIQNPDYYVHTTKSGTVQVRKRKSKLGALIQESRPKTPNESTIHVDKDVKIVVPKSVEIPVETERSEGARGLEEREAQTKPKTDYEAITNKQLLEKMMLILEKTTESKDKNLNDCERERETKENKEFLEGTKSKVESSMNVETQRKTVDNTKNCKSRNLLSKQQPQSQLMRKGRNLLH